MLRKWLKTPFKQSVFSKNPKKLVKRSKTVKRAPLYIFKVKNNIINRFFIRIVRNKLNKKRYTLVCRGRHSNRKGLYEKHGWKYTKYLQNEVPLKYAETIGIYLRDKNEMS
jgi:hypothetical protein|tara:strand:- start:1528 stop:1860 length:333 start_codon:yes stop_codon:yes gene_type:complete